MKAIVKQATYSLIEAKTIFMWIFFSSSQVAIKLKRVLEPSGDVKEVLSLNIVARDESPGPGSNLVVDLALRKIPVVGRVMVGISVVWILS